MAGTLPPAASDRADDAGRYQPLAPLAIAATVVSGLVAVTTIILVLVGLLTGKRVLELGLIFGSILGIALSVAGRWQVKQSEGARSGMTMATYSWWASLICGLVYGAYYLGTILSIRSQAQDFLNASWYPALQKRDIDRAFFYTQKPIDRYRKSEADVIRRFSDQYAQFRRHELAHVIERSNGELVVEPEGFTGQEERQRAMHLQQLYTIRTREGWFRGAVSVVRASGKETEGTQFHAGIVTPTLHEKRLTAYGRILREVSAEGEAYLREACMKNAPYRFVEFYLDTKDISAEDRRDWLYSYFFNTFLRNAVLAPTTPGGGLGSLFSLSATLGDNDVNRTLMLPADAFTAVPKIVTIVEPPARRPGFNAEAIRKVVLQGSTITPPTTLMQAEVPTSMELKADEIIVGLPIECHLPSPIGAAPGTIYAKLVSPSLMQELDRLRKADWQSLEEDKTQGVLISRYRRHWVLTGLHIDFGRATESPNTPMGPGPGAKPPGMPKE